ncbi:hypothetical protein [Ferrimonas kyonanensis]|uniref:hypothetical protein n=1 Tax=Ferrimonas kyonanensis TaxID=364763 RepID=UPI0003FAE72C|nr:hypothetical protein [Ferrimonas kyonanensis]
MLISLLAMATLNAGVSYPVDLTQKTIHVFQEQTKDRSRYLLPVANDDYQDFYLEANTVASLKAATAEIRRAVASHNQLQASWVQITGAPSPIGAHSNLIQLVDYVQYWEGQHQAHQPEKLPIAEIVQGLHGNLADFDSHYQVREPEDGVEAGRGKLPERLPHESLKHLVEITMQALVEGPLQRDPYDLEVLRVFGYSEADLGGEITHGWLKGYDPRQAAEEGER